MKCLGLHLTRRRARRQAELALRTRRKGYTSACGPAHQNQSPRAAVHSPIPAPIAARIRSAIRRGQLPRSDVCSGSTWYTPGSDQGPLLSILFRQSRNVSRLAPSATSTIMALRGSVRPSASACARRSRSRPGTRPWPRTPGSCRAPRRARRRAAARWRRAGKERHDHRLGAAKADAENERERQKPRDSVDQREHEIGETGEQHGQVKVVERPQPMSSLSC